MARRIDKGRGQPVVFLHGIASTGENWRQVADMLDDKHYRVIVLDLLGFGDSPRPDWMQYSVDDHAKAVVTSLRRLRTRRPAILVGHSMGSLVAAHIAEKYPRKVKQLILYQMPVYADFQYLHTKDLRRQAYMSVFKYLAEHPKVTLWYARLLGRTASRMVGFVLNEQTWQPFELSLRNTIMQQQSVHRLRRLKMPTDVVYGRYDPLVIRRNLIHYFKPSKTLRFYEIDEIHRVSSRSNRLLFELITQEPDNRQELSVDHARLVDMTKVKKLEQKPQAELSPRSTYWNVLGAAGLVSLVLSALVWGGKLPTWEQQLYVALNGVQTPGFVDFLARAASDFVWLSVIAVAVALLIKKYFWAAYRIAVPAVTARVVIGLTEYAVGRTRPEELLPDETVQRASQDGYGFPSGHIAVMTVIILVLWPYLTTPLRWLAVALIVLVGWSRIYLGVHFPLDVAAGLSYGVAVFCAFRLLPERLRTKLRLQ